MMRLRGGAAFTPIAAAKPGGDGEIWLGASVSSWRELSDTSTACVDDGTPIRHIYEMELDVERSGGLHGGLVQYAPGDCISIKSPNPPALVLAVVDMLSPCRYVVCQNISLIFDDTLCNIAQDIENSDTLYSMMHMQQRGERRRQCQ